MIVKSDANRPAEQQQKYTAESMIKYPLQVSAAVCKSPPGTERNWIQVFYFQAFHFWVSISFFSFIDYDCLLVDFVITHDREALLTFCRYNFFKRK